MQKLSSRVNSSEGVHVETYPNTHAAYVVKCTIDRNRKYDGHLNFKENISPLSNQKYVVKHQTCIRTFRWKYKCMKDTFFKIDGR
jgi:hypothetical protein